jgi:uncharacterized protein (TIGR03083 family)
MNDQEIKEAVAGACNDLADVLTDLPTDAWDRPSLCDGWRVREVAAHLTMPARYSTPRLALEVVKSRGSFNRMADRTAHRDAPRPVTDFLAALRSTKLYEWKPPGGRHEGALTHAIVHGLDITVALGLGRAVPTDSLLVVLQSLTDQGSLKFFRLDFSGVELRARDIEWSWGSGETVTGDAQTLALVLSGRRPPTESLQGALAPRFTRL